VAGGSCAEASVGGAAITAVRRIAARQPLETGNLDAIGKF
jgi:hypothetical protein